MVMVFGAEKWVGVDEINDKAFAASVEREIPSH
jgi:hypothetical protein